MAEDLIASNIIAVGRVYLSIEIIDLREAIGEENFSAKLDSGVLDSKSAVRVYRFNQQLEYLTE